MQPFALEPYAAPNPPDKRSGANKFGGPWTRLKLEAVEKYLSAFTGALKNQNFILEYIDAFAGSGRCEISERGLVHEIDGSAVRALRTKPPFSAFTFIELKPQKVSALTELKETHRDRDIRVVMGDANTTLVTMCANPSDWRRRRAVAFLDPFGMHVEWQTLEAIAATHAIDVWYLFPLGGLIRQAARNPDALDDAKRASLTKTLGTTEWRTAWYGSTPQSNLFGTVPRESRQFDVAQITSWVTTRLARVFPGSVGPRIFYSLKNGHQQTALFALYFLISNPSPAARNLACKMARDIMAKL